MDGGMYLSPRGVLMNQKVITAAKHVARCLIQLRNTYIHKNLTCQQVLFQFKR
jgi:hypothetical protein